MDVLQIFEGLCNQSNIKHNRLIEYFIMVQIYA